MTALLIYMLKSAFVLSVLTLLYRATLRHETFHRFNRAVLLLIALASFALPALNISTAAPTPVNEAVATAEAWLTGQVSATVTPLSAPSAGAGSAAPSAWPGFLAGLYVAGVVASLIRGIFQYVSLARLFRSSRFAMRRGNLNVYFNDGLRAPVSWMHHVFMSPADFRHHADSFLAHEGAHADQRHALDIMASRIIIPLQWFNPAVYLWTSDLRAVHEFLADSAASSPARAGTAYQLLLIKKAAAGGAGLAAAHGFNACPIKLRITMMYHTPSPRSAMLKGLLFVPAALLALGAFARPASEAQAPSQSPSAVAPSASAAAREAEPVIPANASQIVKEITQHIVYPQSAVEKGISGTVIVQIKIDKAGNIQESTIVKSLHPDCDKAVLTAFTKVSKETLKAIAGIMGKQSDTFMVPVRFRVQ